MQPSCKQRQGISVRGLRGCTKPLVKPTANNAVVVDQRNGLVRDDFFELIFGRAARDVCRSRFR